MIVVTPIRTKFSASGWSARSSAWVCTSMKPGATISPVASITSRASPRAMRADRRDPPLSDRHVRPPRRLAGAIHHLTADDGEVVARRLRRAEHHHDRRDPGQDLHAGALATGFVIRLTSDADHDDGDHADRVVPQKRDAAGRGWSATTATTAMPAISPTNAPVPVGALEPERQHEHAEERPVEERPEAVHHLDERAEPGRIHRHDAGERAPRSRSQLRDRQVVRVGGGRLQQPPVEVDHASRRERVQLGGDASTSPPRRSPR